MRLFSPGPYSQLAGMALPRPEGAPPEWFPAKDELAAYLEAYAERFSLPIRLSTAVRSLSREGPRYLVTTDAGTLSSRAVIVATGAHQHPSVPDLAEHLGGGIAQLHSSEYRRPSELRAGPALVVGAGASGAEIAMELAGSGRAVTLAGPEVTNLPARILGRDLYWWLYATRIIRARCDRPPGRWICRRGATGGDERVGISRRDLRRAGIRRAGRITSVAGGLPATADGQTLDVPTVIWCTGYRPAFREWIDLPVLDDRGELRQSRGVVKGEPALFSVGRPFQAHPDSGLVGGVSNDAAFVADRLTAALA